MMNLIGGFFLFIVTWKSSIVNALPVKIAQSPQEITTILTSDRLLGPLLVANLVQLIWYLVKSIFDSKKKQLDQIQKTVDLIPQLVHKVEIMDQHLKQNVPTKDQVELLVYRKLQDKNQ